MLLFVKKNQTQVMSLGLAQMSCIYFTSFIQYVFNLLFHF